MAQQDQWQQDSPADDGSIGRLDAALTRIALAAGRRQDALREAELTARAARHEAELLARSQQRRQQEEGAGRLAADAALLAAREEEIRTLSARLDALLDTVRAAVGSADGQAVRPNLPAGRG